MRFSKNSVIACKSDLEYNEIGHVGASDIGDMIKHISTLETLSNMVIYICMEMK